LQKIKAQILKILADKSITAVICTVTPAELFAIKADLSYFGFIKLKNSAVVNEFASDEVRKSK